ncbi:hypothetical protein [Schlesneria paludicola]|uniref:hypothetical protein n=1 Tax=Schlesneria paludicola TaxID=360056 RepID=UPI00029B505E|nr:hypothetical protein [Schlesneria paludicola]
MTTADEASRHWIVVGDEKDCVSTVGDKPLTELQDSEFIDCNTIENAQLIAAAPDLLEALEMLVRWDETGTPVSDLCFMKARSAIAKAKGGMT